MSLGKISTAVAVALALSVAPAMAAANPASKLSVTSVSKQQRAGARVKGNEAIGGGIIIAILAAAAVIAGIVIAADGNDTPTSA